MQNGKRLENSFIYEIEFSEFDVDFRLGTLCSENNKIKSGEHFRRPLSILTSEDARLSSHTRMHIASRELRPLCEAPIGHRR